MSEMEKKFEKAEAEVDKRYENFDPKRLTEESTKLQEVFAEGLGIVKFGPLTFNDIIAIEKESRDLQERAVKYIHVMLRKAYPDLTFSQVASWDSMKVANLMLAFQKAGFFQPPPK